MQTCSPRPANLSLGYSTRDQFLLERSDTVIYVVSNSLAFEEFRPSHLSFLCLIQLPGDTLSLLALKWFCGPCGKEWRVGFTLFKKGNKAMNEKSGQNGKVSHCSLSPWHPLYHTSEAPGGSALWRGILLSHSSSVLLLSLKVNSPFCLFSETSISFLLKVKTRRHT